MRFSQKKRVKKLKPQNKDQYYTSETGFAIFVHIFL
jgi:hypothetical protein